MNGETVEAGKYIDGCFKSKFFVAWAPQNE